MRERERRAKNKRVDFLDDLLRTLDIFVYAELSAVYYMDCSFLRFALRASIQFFYLTPKPPLFPEAPKHRPYIGAIVGSNVLCLLLHLFLAAPTAGEATRGYLHGGLMIDFIGQQGPTSKLHLAILDVMILLLQLVTLATYLKRQNLKRTLPTPSPTAPQDAHAAEPLPQPSPDSAATIPSPPAVAQDHDAEEQGILRRSSTASSTQDPPNETDDLLASPQDGPAASPIRNTDLLDAYAAGQASIANLYVWDTVRDQFRAWQGRPATVPATGTAASATGFAAQFAGRRFGIQIPLGGGR
ncbi:hypothetical protein H2201_008533 [Coniosporium apollinis]|uniref:DUF1746 domain-containing protein n=1 Tax=Coniosporium apollinis TaxID=61459 RepID=A0ABQ9NGP8_9PEZI|nr:hypothetical protein H2201_008533 [Coniosporium apollinis]